MQPKLDTGAEQLLEQLYEIIALSTPLKWQSIRVPVLSTVLTSMWTGYVQMKDGTHRSVALQNVFSERLDQFRGACYEPGRGTWYSATFDLDVDGARQVRLDFDEKPEWRAWPHPQTFVRDLEFFPRDDEHMPDWLREQIELAATAETEGRQG